ncbi:Neuroglian [Caenorhabditis elegans]|uniref:Neuroglian n=1 Tax=Caenorhabditis elegans TaxID=6239 RepID=Q53U87_CAEEL|nr:Neuroglian [Caenorhabditis elegans]BAD97388.1 SAX-7 LONGFORM [Caenorhabditis elegans]CCD65186.1 Neuroglian [Caenorhabditis elegans]|eukprot:NP_001033396.1 Sensory AXon guidance [Caenorhabditis elegans]
MRSFIFLLLLTGHISSGSIDWSAIETPPQFVHDKNADTVYFKVEKSGMSDESAKNTPGNLLEQTIHCYANGNPRPSYRWKKDGKTFLPSMFPEKVVQKPGEGSLVFSRLDESDAGLYQCEAENSNGTAVDRPVRVQETWIRHFKTAEPEVVVVEVGDPYQRNCSPPASNPYARVYWILMGKEPGHFETISSSHISSNEQGTLFFHYVNETDFKSDRYYTCTAENIELKDYKFGNQFSLQITNNKRRSLQQMPPTEQYVNQSSPIALQGNQHKLHCFFSGYPAPKPRWFHNGREISEDSDAAGFRFESYGKTLVFNVTQDKAGKYDCRFATQQDIDRTFNVVVEAAPYWPLGPPPNTNTSEGEKVIFDCTTYGKPTPKVTFYKNGVEIESQKDDRYLIEGTRLTIFDVKKGTYGKGDNAVYQCKSENKHGWLWTNFYLNLLAFKPQLLIDPGKEEVEAVAGKKVTLECKFFASPNAAVKWEAPMISGSKGNQIPADAYGVGKLVFSEVTAAEEGEYECIGTNKYGQATGLITLKVRKPTIVQPFPRVEEVRMAGEEMRLACDATADNQLEVKYEWLVDGKSLPEDRISSGHYKIDDDHSLVISNPTQDDTAKYKCVVSTKLDQVEKEIKIQFKDVPVAVHSAWVQTCDKNSLTAFIKFEHYESIHTIAPIKEFWVQYQIDSETEGSQWRTHPVPSAAHPNDKIDNNLRHTTGDATVSLQPFGKYVFRVIARNSVGDSAARLAKDQCETPAKQPDKNPDEVAAKGTSPENIIVQWKPMSREEWNGADFHYVVKYRPKDEDQRVGDWKEVAVEDPFADRVTVNLDDEKDVKPFQPYEVQVQAVNSEGRTNVVPETVEGRTGEGVPSSIPSGLRVLEKSGTTVTLAWNGVDPQTANGNFTGYKITYWVDEADQDSDDSSEDDEDDEKRKFRWKRSIRVKRQSGIRKTVVFGPSATQGTLTDLKPATLNHAYIQVTNGAHEGSASDTIDFQTDEGVPSPVRSLRAYPMNSKVGGEKGVVVLVWKKPRQTNGKLARYEVEYCKTQNGKLVEKSCPRKQIDADSKEIRITGLENETPYRFILRAHTSAGEGDPNSSDATTLPETTAAGVDPGVPSLVENAIGDKYFNVSFRPAKYDDESRAPVGNTYEVQYKPQDADEWETVKPADDGLTVHVDGLSPGTKYDVRVAALQVDPEGGETTKTLSGISKITTTGTSSRERNVYLLILLLLILLLLLIICCICCVVCRQRGQNYPVSQREREQGREPILGKPDYKTDDDEKRSLTGSKAESETDSMAQYGDTDPGVFTEDGSFIAVSGQYVPQKSLMPAERPEKGSTSTFV